MTVPWVHIADLVDRLPEIPADSIVSLTLLKEAHTKAVLFGFAPGQELSEHTAAQPAILHFLEGQARLTLGDEEQLAGPGTWVYMQPQLPHSVYAQTRVVMLLLLVGAA